MTNSHFDKLRSEYDEITTELQNTTDPAKLKSLARRHIELGQILERVDELNKLIGEKKDNTEILEKSEDGELRHLAQEELDKIGSRVPALESEIKRLLIPRDPADSGDAIVEIRAGTGGDEASPFAGQILRMYTRFAARPAF